MPPNLSPEWQKIIRDLVRLGTKIAHGDIHIIIHDGKPALTELTIKKKPADAINADDEFIVKDLLGP